MTKPYDNPDKLTELYHEKNMTIPQIADELNSSTGTIYNRMEKFEIERRNSGRNRLSAPSLTYHRSKWGQYEAFVSHTNGKQDRILHHRLLAVAVFGFENVKEMDVHHKNELKWDNRPANLELRTRKDHMKYHAEDRDQERNELGHWK